jgi:hypothetical protein
MTYIGNGKFEVRLESGEVVNTSLEELQMLLKEMISKDSKTSPTTFVEACPRSYYSHLNYITDDNEDNIVDFLDHIRAFYEDNYIMIKK